MIRRLLKRPIARMLHGHGPISEVQPQQVMEIIAAWEGISEDRITIEWHAESPFHMFVTVRGTEVDSRMAAAMEQDEVLPQLKLNVPMEPK